MEKLDRYDIKILIELSNRGRLTKSDLAQKINLSIAACSERIKRLEKSGIIRSYHANIDINKLSPNICVYVEVTLNKHTAQELQHFERLLIAKQEVTHCVATGGGIDYLFIVNTQTIQNYQEFIDQLLEECTLIEKYFTYIVTKWIKDTPFNRLLLQDDTYDTK